MTPLRTDDKLFMIGRRGIIDDPFCAAGIIRQLRHIRGALRMHQKQRVGMEGFDPQDIFFLDFYDAWDKAFPTIRCFLRALFRDEPSQIAIRFEYNIFFFRQPLDDFDRIGGRDDDIGFGFHSRGRIDISRDGIAGIFCF